MRIGTWNVRGINGKEVELIEEIKKYRIDLLGITETKKKGQFLETIDNYKIIYSGVNKTERAKAGVGIAIREDLYEDSDFRCINERLLEIDIELKERKLKVIVAYGPNESDMKEEREIFYSDLQMVIDNVKTNQEVMIIGDLNAKVGKNAEINCGAIGREGESELTANGELLLDLCIRNNLKIANTFFKHKDIHKWTRVAESRNEKSIIDYIIVSNKLFYNTDDVKVKRGAELFSDHYMVLGKFNLDINFKKKVQKERQITKIKIEDLKDPIVKVAYQRIIKSKLKNSIQEQEIENIESAWSVYKNTLIEAANEVCGQKRIGGKQKRTQWWNEKVKQKVKEKKEAWKRYLTSKRQDDLEDYRCKRKIASEEVKRSKQLQWEMFGEKLENNFKENQKLFWGAIKRCRQTNQSQNRKMVNSRGEVIKDNSQILETWKDYFKTLHNPIDGNENEILPEENDAIDSATGDNEEDNISMVEFIKAKKKIKLGKAAGADQVFPEMIVNQDIEADKLLLKIFQTAYKTKSIPNDWNISVIIPIHKSGPTNKCENYRGISLLSVPGKLYARILETRLRELVESQLDQYQSGFRAGRSVQDHIYSVRQLSEKTYRYNQETHLCFIDLQKAFDSVKRKELWKSLKEHNVNTSLIKAIQSFYIKPEGMVRIKGETTNKFNIEVGVRQGCILSPLLFIILMNSISKQCKGMRAVELGMWKLKPVTLKMLAFADDLVICGKTQRDLQHNLTILNKDLKKKGLTINTKKTKSMILSREPSKHEIRLNNELLEQVDHYKYLGVIIASNCSLKAEINQRIAKANAVYSQLGQQFIGKKELTLKTKRSIFNSVYCPTLIYGSETWNLDTSDKSRLQAAEMKFLRRSVGKTKRDKIRNTRIREETKTDSLKIKIERNQLRWFGHVNRMEDQRIPKQILKSRQSEKLPRGRPKQTWLEKIEDVIESRGSTLKEANQVSLERDRWRKFVWQI